MPPLRCLLLASLAALAAVASAAPAPTLQIIPTGGRQIYRLAIARTGDARLLVGTTWDNRLSVFTSSGEHRWDAPLGGFGFDVCCADLDGDGTDEILTAGADGVVTCFSADGRARWKFTFPAPAQQVTVARLDGKSPVVLAGGVSREIAVLSPTGQLLRALPTAGALGGTAVRMLRAGDFDGDGRDEVGYVGIRGRALDLQFLRGPDLKPDSVTHSLNALKTANGTVADVTGDAAAELLVGRALLSLQRPAATTAARPVQLPDEPKTSSYADFYRMRSLAAGDFTDRPGREIAILDGPDLQLCAPDGTVLGSAQAPLAFTDIVRLPGSPHDSVILGSGQGGDDNLYRLTFERGWQSALAKLPRTGSRQVVGENVERLGRQAAAWKGPAMIGAPGPIDIVVTHHMWAPRTTAKAVDDWIAEVRFFEKNLPYPNLRYSTCVWPGEQLPLKRPDGVDWSHDHRLSHDLSRAQMVEMARRFEAARCPYWIQVGHGCSPHLSVASATAMLEASPNMCLGFVSAEDEQAEHMAYYFEHHVQPLLELCLTRGKRFIPRNKNVWWAQWPADPTLRRLIFNGRYRSVLLPCVEDSNTRAADTNLAARVGLWLDGQVDDWASRISADWFSFNRAWEWEAVRTGHPHLRYLTSQALLGARVFMLLAGDRERAGGDWTPVGTEGVVPFIHLLGRGTLTPPTREQLRGISPVVLNFQKVSARFARHGANGHAFQHWDTDGTDRQAWAFDRLDAIWGMAPLPDTDASTWLWDRRRRAADHLPITPPHGFVAILPGPAPQSSTRWPTVWSTDGDHLSKGGQKFTLTAARTAMLADLNLAAGKLPFRVDGRVFWQVVAQPGDRYLLCVMDPGWVDPAGRTAVVKSQLPGTWLATDRLSGHPLGPLGPGLSLTIPAGAFVLLDLSRPAR